MRIVLWILVGGFVIFSAIGVNVYAANGDQARNEQMAKLEICSRATYGMSVERYYTAHGFMPTCN